MSDFKAKIHQIGFPLGLCLGLCPRVTGTFAPKNFRSRERMYHGMELSLPGAKVPRTFAPGTFVPWNYRSLGK